MISRACGSPDATASHLGPIILSAFIFALGIDRLNQSVLRNMCTWVG